ncbi:PREDICTED: myosin heavy chain, cardiac muscle isoform isoform X2 [Populus euphratica]|uniref:Myosin heavy chain, cardiac muscle isoform isoform X2 n=1 Tax=Populus euphratica TaxID=75702 RepID=A0AAJ6VBU2_POPEU|nr:PREDICTED: myosin heavy chain, cardiac muscle isoform isoform X2 [Populus euphratica]
MDRKEVSGSYLTAPEGKSDSFYPMYFGVSCALFVLKVLTKPVKEDDRWSELCDKMLRGSAHLLRLLVWKIQREGADGEHCELLHKLETAENEIMELKKIRCDDAKANENVVSISASQEQSWLIERKELRQHIGGLISELRVLEKKNKEAISELNEKLNEMKLLVQSKDKAVEEEEHKRKELEEKLAKTEKVAEELRETAKRKAQEHSTDILKHKTAFLELVSNQRQLEAEMGRALRQLEAKRKELDAVLEQKEESMVLTQKLSMEVVKVRKDLEQKDKILSAMLRKSKLDTTEKKMLLKEVKFSKSKKKKAELETTESWKSVSESKHEKHSLRSMFSLHTNLMRSEDPPIERGASQLVKGGSQSIDYDLEYENPEFQKNSEVFSPLSNLYSPEGCDELADGKRLEGWVRSEAGKYAATIEKRHQLEMDAFAEQMRLKDEKLEAFRWRMLSMEIESKRLQSHIEGLNRDVSRIRRDNMKLEALLLERQKELTDLKDQLKAQIRPQFCQQANLSSSLDDPALVHDSILSRAKNVKKEPTENKQEGEVHLTETSQEKNTEKEEDEEALHNQSRNVSKIVQSPENEFEEEKDVSIQGCTQEASASPVVVDTVEQIALTSQSLMKTNNSTWGMDLHALGVSYKIKRLKQQLLMLERLTGKQDSGEHLGNSDEAKTGIKVFQALMSLLNKQVNKYQSLQEKTDELCKRMHDNDVDVSRRDSSTSTARKKGETKTLEQFLEETFQVQRYMVATGQKLVEVQSRIASDFVKVPEELGKAAGSFDMKRFADSIKTLFQEVQRGLEVRIARIIGDLGGTLACEGMIRMRGL